MFLVYLLSPVGSGSSFCRGGRSIGSVVSVTGLRNSYVCTPCHMQRRIQGGCYWCCSIRPVPETGPRPRTRKREMTSLFWLWFLWLVQFRENHYNCCTGCRAGPRHGRGGPRASEPLCETAVFAMFILSTTDFCPMLILWQWSGRNWNQAPPL